MHTEVVDNLYELVLKIAALPVLALLIFFSWLIINSLMSPDARQARRNRQIRKAVAARRALFPDVTVQDTAISEEKNTPAI